MRRKRRWLAGLFLLALVLSLPLLVNLEVIRQQVRRAVGRQLGREVEVASLTGRLLPRPAVVGRRAVVGEAEGFGAEAFLYAEEVHCDLPLRLLWTWRLHCSRIHFQRPSLNLVRSSERGWNVATFLVSGGSAAGRKTVGGAPAPMISADEGRINFKLGAFKQVHTLTAVRGQIEPLGEGRWRLTLEGSPGRGDRRLSETGTLRVQGELGRAAEFSALPFRFEAGLEGGSLAQLAAFATGRDPPVRARASFGALLIGTPADWRARGRLGLADLRHRELGASPRHPGWEGEFSLYVREKGRVVEFERIHVRGQQSELELTGRVEEPLGQPRWNLELRVGRLGLDELMAQWAGLKANVPAEARWEGEARLALEAPGPLREWKGELTAPGSLRLRAPGLAQPVEFAGLRLRLQRGRLELAPLTVRFSPLESLTLRGDWQPLAAGRPYRLRWQSPGVELQRLESVAAALGWELFGATRWEGRAQLDLDWSGELASGAEPRWQGRVELREARFHPVELNRPLEVVQAGLRWRKDLLEVQPLELRLGEHAAAGSFERRGNAGQWTGSLSSSKLSLDTLDELFSPARRGLLERLVGAEPRRAWGGEELAAIGDVRVDELAAGSFRLRQLQARAGWHGGRLELSELRFRAYGGRFEGRLQADFRAAPPQYRLAGNLKQVNLAGLLADTTELGGLFSGMAGADLSFETSGTRSSELRRHLQGRVVGVVYDGSLAHINLLGALAAAAAEEQPAEPTAGTPTAVQSLAGDFRVAEERVELDAVRLIVEGAALELSGRVQFDGGLDLRLRGEPLRVAGRGAAPDHARLFAPLYRLNGTLRRPQVERSESPR